MMPGRVDVDAAPVHLPAESVHSLPIETRRLAPTRYLFVRIGTEVYPEARPDALHPYQQTCLCESAPQAVLEPLV